MPPRLFVFAGTHSGAWRLTNLRCLVGEPLPLTSHLQVCEAQFSPSSGSSAWVLRGITSNERYITRGEKSQLAAVQEGLGRPASTCAALIPIRKNASWWALSQDERRAVFEKRSHHVKLGLKHLPAVARRLHHCRDLSEHQPFDFLTWFEYAPADEQGFSELLADLRASEEWKYVDREVDIRLTRDDARPFAAADVIRPAASARG